MTSSYEEGGVRDTPPSSSPPRGSLTVVGTGISLVVHTTVEALWHIQRAQRVFYLVTDAVAEDWIRCQNPAATSLQDCYAEGKSRRVSYEEMIDRMLAPVRGGQQVCAAFYGHPGVFAWPGHEAVRRARAAGCAARMLPGISSEDCLFADLGIDPGDQGCQSFEATDFLALRRRFDPSSSLILWQVGALGEPSIRMGMTCRPERLRVLTSRLRKSYPAEHPVVLYRASPFSICDAVIRRTTLKRLSAESVPVMATLYIPPLPARAADPRVVRWMREGLTQNSRQ
jgi:siroheme synthase